ncbi:MAG: tetratricopeptide repeat protein [Candidatus Ratteibacteria bacterium]
MKRNQRILIEKNFYEKLIKINPNFTEVFLQLSRIYDYLKENKKILKIDEKIAELLPFDPISYYNLACDYSQLGNLEKSLKNLKIAILLGFKNKKYIKKDPDLRNLRKSNKFKEIEKILKR